MNLIDNYLQIKDLIPQGVKLVAVSKFKTTSVIRTLFEQTGHRIFGESRAQEFISKQVLLPDEVEWHFIGHLQTNKVKFVAPNAYLIHSVDSYKLLKEINREGERNNKTISILLQFHIATEESKFGFSIEEVRSMLEGKEFQDLNHVCIMGVMGMATLSDDNALIRKEFAMLRSHFETMKSTYFEKDQRFCEISMGMSGDYKIAIDEGSTMVRIGSLIFGERS
jgi:PLP dependent protein